MTRRQGDFLCRGVHVVGKRGAVHEISTPKLAALRCRWCGHAGVTVTAAVETPAGRIGRLYGWCDVEHMRASGVVAPAGDTMRRSK